MGLRGRVLWTLAQPAPTPMAPCAPSSSSLVWTSVPENKGVSSCTGLDRVVSATEGLGSGIVAAFTSAAGRVG